MSSCHLQWGFFPFFRGKKETHKFCRFCSFVHWLPIILLINGFDKMRCAMAKWWLSHSHRSVIKNETFYWKSIRAHFVSHCYFCCSLSLLLFFTVSCLQHATVVVAAAVAACACFPACQSQKWWITFHILYILCADGVCVQQAYRKIPYVQCERWMILEIPNKFKQQSIILLCVTNFPSSLSIGFTGSFISFATPQQHSPFGWLAGYLTPAPSNTVTVKLLWMPIVLALALALSHSFTFIKQFRSMTKIHIHFVMLNGFAWPQNSCQLFLALPPCRCSMYWVESGDKIF